MFHKLVNKTTHERHPLRILLQGIPSTSLKWWHTQQVTVPLQQSGFLIHLESKNSRIFYLHIGSLNRKVSVAHSLVSYICTLTVKATVKLSLCVHTKTTVEVMEHGNQLSSNTFIVTTQIMLCYKMISVYNTHYELHDSKHSFSLAEHVPTNKHIFPFL